MSDDDFDLLKQDLSWEGSQLVYLTKNETLFLTAMSAYLKGQVCSESDTMLPHL
jgi:hypothetical protein